MCVADTKQAEKEYLARTGSTEWERVKPFSSPGTDTLAESARLLHDFSIAMLALQPQPGDQILDLGAGGGWVSDLLGRLNRSTVAVDISVEMLRTGRTRPGANIRGVAGDMEHLPFKTGAFDKAICLSALHHVPDIPAALHEIARVLTDDGVAFFSEPGKGHADARASTAAMRDFGVLEQEILIEDFARACTAAGFRDVRIKPMSYAIPEFDLRVDEWARWSRLARSKRPVRALGTLRRGVLEFFGAGKQTTLFEETKTMSLVRLLRGAVEDHPMMIASKSALRQSKGAGWSASITLLARPTRATAGSRATVRLRLTNTGTRPWPHADPGRVTVGVQWLDRDGRLKTKEFHRVPLEGPIAPQARAEMVFECPMPPEPGRCQLKFDLVAEGVTWFEAAGSTAVVTSIDVEPQQRT